MSRLVAAVVLAIFTALGAVDAVCCPDGCTTDEQASGSSRRAPDLDGCMLCLGGIDASTRHALTSCGEAAQGSPVLALLPPESVTPDPLEHPPRA